MITGYSLGDDIMSNIILYSPEFFKFSKIKSNLQYNYILLFFKRQINL